MTLISPIAGTVLLSNFRFTLPLTRSPVTAVLPAMERRPSSAPGAAGDAIAMESNAISKSPTEKPKGLGDLSPANVTAPMRTVFRAFETANVSTMPLYFKTPVAGSEVTCMSTSPHSKYASSMVWVPDVRTKFDLSTPSRPMSV